MEANPNCRLCEGKGRIKVGEDNISIDCPECIDYALKTQDGRITYLEKKIGKLEQERAEVIRALDEAMARPQLHATIKIHIRRALRIMGCRLVEDPVWNCARVIFEADDEN